MHGIRRLISTGWALLMASSAAAAQPAKNAATIDLGIECEQFEFTGDWSGAEAGPGQSASGGKFLVSGAQRTLPAATVIEIPRAGRYFLWVRALDFPDDRPGTRIFSVTVAGKSASEIFGDSGKPGFTWERGGAFELPAGPTILAVHARTPFARADAILLTTDGEFTPMQPLASTGRYRRITPQKASSTVETDPLAAVPVTLNGAQPVAQLANEFVRIGFVPATRGGLATVCPIIAVKTEDGWKDVPADPASEIYSVVDAGAEAQLDYAGFYPAWKSGRQKTDTVTLAAGGARVETARAGKGAIWQAGELIRVVPRTARAVGAERVRLEFHPTKAGSLAAEWELRAGERAARVRLEFKPVTAGQFSLGYHLFFRRPLAEVNELLLPMMWHRHRLPEQPRTLLDPLTPTPVALAETTRDGGAVTWAIIGEPAAIPFEWPQHTRPHFGLGIRDHAGAVQPAIYGPVPGTESARRKAGEAMQLAFRVLVQPGDWYAGFRTAADGVFGLRDYRSNVGVSLTDAALNMIDLLKDDERGGWWERGKGFYQIETKNGVTHASPLALLSLYRLTGDEELYRRRARPAMEYVLSRRSAHFSPTPHDTGRYDAGGMDGPVRLFGTTTLGGFWEMTQRRTPAFAQFALPQGVVRPTAGYSHVQPFDDWLARYEVTGDAAALQRARSLADDYIERQIRRRQTAELGAQPFFFISFVPDWEGLLRLFEATEERRYLDAATFGARQLMTGLWTQPLFPAGEVTAHPGRKFVGDTYPSWRGPVPYRLGSPRRANDTPERKVPAWMLSNVGLGFEQPSTYRGSAGGRMIYQMGWAADFLRLARHTGDRAFETCARNAVLGRWANYPGYYATGFTDMPLNPRYPWDGPDVTDFYYHHIAPHLAWTIDYLVAEAELRSGGRIAFPSQRQNGYAYFDSRVFGHAPGKILDADGAWLWLRRGLVTIDNPQLNFLTARRDGQFFVILMNESAREERATVRFAADALQFDPRATREVAMMSGAAKASTLPLRNGAAEVALAPRGLVVLRLDGAAVDVPVHRRSPNLKPAAHPGYVVLKTAASMPEVRAATLQVKPGPWDAYVWCTATPEQAKSVTLHYSTGGDWQQRKDVEYPFEFSVPVASAGAAFRFYVAGSTADGKEFRTAEALLGASDN